MTQDEICALHNERSERRSLMNFGSILTALRELMRGLCAVQTRFYLEQPNKDGP
jgi:hypothetical protein